MKYDFSKNETTGKIEVRYFGVSGEELYGVRAVMAFERESNFDRETTKDEIRKEFNEALDGAFHKWATSNGIAVVGDSLPEEMLENLLSRDLNLVDIQNSTPEQLMEEALAWQGIVGYGSIVMGWAKAMLGGGFETSKT